MKMESGEGLFCYVIEVHCCPKTLSHIYVLDDMLLITININMVLNFESIYSHKYSRKFLTNALLTPVLVTFTKKIVSSCFINVFSHTTFLLLY